MTYHKPKAILSMANRLLNTRPDASSALVLREAASMLRDIASGGAHLSQPVQEHEAHCNLRHSATFGTPEDYCDCAVYRPAQVVDVVGICAACGGTGIVTDTNGNLHPCYYGCHKPVPAGYFLETSPGVFDQVSDQYKSHRDVIALYRKEAPALSGEKANPNKEK